MKIVSLLLALLLPFAVSAKIKKARDGNAVGNGGGVICIQGKCQTLVEAGLKISPEYDGVWFPEDFHYSYVKSRIDRSLAIAAPLKNQIFNGTFGRTDHFRRVDVIDNAKLEAIKKLYIETAKQSGHHLDPATFEVIAFSSDDTVEPAMTYLLPSFFKLSGKQQGDLLIHEGLYRGRPSSDLKYVWQLESSMEVLATQSDEKLSCIPYGGVFKTCIDQQIISYRLRLISKDQLIGFVLSMIKNGYDKYRASDTTSLDEFGEVKFETNGTGTYTIDHNKLLKFGEVEPRLPYMFSKVETLALKKTGPNSNKYGDHLSVSWQSLKPTEFLSCKGAGTNNWYQCEGYSVVDPESIPLLLPN